MESGELGMNRRLGSVEKMSIIKKSPGTFWSPGVTICDLFKEIPIRRRLPTRSVCLVSV